MSTAWAPDSWRERVAAQQPRWPDEAALEASLKQLHTLPPLVFAGEARALTADLAQVADGKAFLLQAGDCAESFDSRSEEHTSELQSLMRISYAVFCLKKK